MGQYNNCLDSFSLSVGSLSCTSNFTMCLDDGIEANACASVSAQVGLLFIMIFGSLHSRARNGVSALTSKHILRDIFFLFEHDVLV